MRALFTLAAAAAALLMAHAACAQDPASAARAADNLDDRVRESRLGQEVLSGSSDPAAHVDVNPNAARIDANARAKANLPNMNSRPVIQGQATVAANDPNRWRFVYHNNQWWYYAPNKTWMYHRDNAWNRYDAATYVNPPYSMGYRGYTNPNSNRRFNYAPGARARGAMNGAAAAGAAATGTYGNGTYANGPYGNAAAGTNAAVPRARVDAAVPPASVDGAINGATAPLGNPFNEPIRDAAEKARGVQPGDPGSPP